MTVIYKAAGNIIKNKKILLERSYDKPFFISPGGRIEQGESAKQALIRELREEFGITCNESDLEEFGTFTAEAANHPGQRVNMKVFNVLKYKGTPKPGSEVEQMLWANTNDVGMYPIGSIMVHKIMPKLKNLGLID